MVGKKANLKFLISKLRRVGVSIVKTTEFVQGQTARWGLAWSFFLSSSTPTSTKISFTIEVYPSCMFCCDKFHALPLIFLLLS